MEFAAKVGEALISASVQTLLDIITSSEFQDFLKNRKLNVSLLDEMKITLLMLGAVLNDAEEKQITNPAVKEWLEELKDAVYDAEDLLDEINTESLRCKVEQDSQSSTSKVRSFFSSSFGGFYWWLNSKLEETSCRLQHFANQKDILGLQSVSLRVHKTPTTSLVNDSVMVGREDDKEKLLQMLLCDEDPKGNAIGVITIWGMGGLGKTTLAQLLYNDNKVQEHFDLKAWTCVSDNFDILEVTKSLVESVTSKVHDTKNLDFLHVKLRNSLSNKKFLVVLDDLWNEDYDDWEKLITPFQGGKRGSKIIVTTRQQSVVEITRTFPAHKLGYLSNDNCWLLLSKHAFANEDPNRYPELEPIGRRIARKCGGLPIAAKTIGGLLRSKVDAKEWNKILSSDQWDVPNDKVMPALRLSYLYLPSHLKKCFAYCSIFPKDLLLEKEKLVLLWVAEGIVQQTPHGEMTSFEIEAEGYFNELFSRSFFQQYGGDPKMFVMHDLLNDLAKIISGKSCVQFEGNTIPKCARHISFSQKEYSGSKDCKNFYHLNCLRTLLPQNEFEDWSPSCVLSKKVLNDLFTKLKCLRVLSIPWYRNVIELPDSIGNLQHLRYLNLSNTSIRRFPDVAFTLYNLQTLLLANCKYFDELPKKIENLINLHHLDISGTALKEMPKQITNLQHLQSLSTFVIGKKPDGLGIEDLKLLPHLQGKLSILNLQNVVDFTDALEETLKKREKIEELVLKWDCDATDSQIVKNVLSALQPSTNLKRLTINHYGGTSFPVWVGNSSFMNITFLCVSDCNYCFSLPSFGELPSLKELSIKGMALVHTIGREFYCSKVECSFQPFPSLELLRFKNMPIWEEWMLFEGEGSKFPFPCLKKLTLKDCPMLEEVSISNCKRLEAESMALSWISSIEELRIEEGEQGLLLEFLRMMTGHHCLQRLFLCDIPSIMSFPMDGLPASLRRLEIKNCENLEFLHQDSWQNYASLDFLRIERSCHSLTSFPLGCFSRLSLLFISDCHNLESFTHVGGSTLSLELLSVENCEKLRSMSKVHIDSLTNLRYLGLIWVPKLETLPQGGLPYNLTSLTLYDCNGLSSIPIEDWGFQRLTSLSLFQVSERGSESILHNLLKNQLLPTSLVRIGIRYASNMKLLEGKGLQHLTFLEELYIMTCENLESLPEDALPSSLLLLQIRNCPKLEERYDYRRGKHFSKIAHIPTIQINDEYYDP